MYKMKDFNFLWWTMKDFIFFRYTMENFVFLLQTMKDFVFLQSQLVVYVESCFFEIHSIQRKLTHLCKKETSRLRFGDWLFSFGSARPLDLVFCIECCRENRLSKKSLLNFLFMKVIWSAVIRHDFDKMEAVYCFSGPRRFKFWTNLFSGLFLKKCGDHGKHLELWHKMFLIKPFPFQNLGKWWTVAFLVFTFSLKCLHKKECKILKDVTSWGDGVQTKMRWDVNIQNLKCKNNSMFNWICWNGQ